MGTNGTPTPSHNGHVSNPPTEPVLARYVKARDQLQAALGAVRRQGFVPVVFTLAAKDEAAVELWDRLTDVLTARARAVASTGVCVVHFVCRPAVARLALEAVYGPTSSVRAAFCDRGAGMTYWHVRVSAAGCLADLAMSYADGLAGELKREVEERIARGLLTRFVCLAPRLHETGVDGSGKPFASRRVGHSVGTRGWGGRGCTAGGLPIIEPEDVEEVAEPVPPESPYWSPELEAEPTPQELLEIEGLAREAAGHV
jgi:hypothetical protein